MKLEHYLTLEQNLIPDWLIWKQTFKIFTKEKKEAIYSKSSEYV